MWLIETGQEIHCLNAISVGLEFEKFTLKVNVILQMLQTMIENGYRIRNIMKKQ